MANIPPQIDSSDEQFYALSTRIRVCLIATVTAIDCMDSLQKSKSRYTFPLGLSIFSSTLLATIITV